MAKTVRVLLENLEIQVDRQARQNSATFWKPVTSSWLLKMPVMVKVPEEIKYIANIPEENLVGALYADEPKAYDPVLTPLGYAFVHQALEDALNELEPESKPLEADDEPWDSGLSNEDFEELED